MAVSKRDREHFQRIGEYKAEAHADALAEHLARSLDERIRRGWQLSLMQRSLPGIRTDDDDPSPFYERARALGLYKP